MATLKVYNGSSWVTAVGKVYDGAAWVEKMAFHDGTSFVDLFSSIVVTLSGEIVVAAVSNGNTATAAVRLVTSDGTIDKQVNATFTQIDSSTDVLIPNGSGAAYHIKFTKGALDPVPDIGTIDTWQAWTSDLSCGYQNSSNDSSRDGTITVHISADGGTSTITTGAYSLSAEVGTPI